MKAKVPSEFVKDSGILLAIVLLIIALRNDREWLQITSIGLLVVCIIKPQVFYPIAFAWKQVGDLLAKWINPLVLGAIFFLVVTPMGILLRMFGKDCVRRKEFKKSRDTVFGVFDRRFTGEDCKFPF